MYAYYDMFINYSSLLSVMYVYLDQNVMIMLAGAMNGSERCREYEGLAHRVMELADADKVRFPASISHVIETQKLPPHRRAPVRKFISELSKGNVIAPVYRQEGVQLVNNMLRRKVQSLKEDVFPRPGERLFQLTKDELDLRQRISYYFPVSPFENRVYSGVTDKSITQFMERANDYSNGFLTEFEERKAQQGLSSLREALLATNLNQAISESIWDLDLPSRARLKRVAKKADPEELIEQAPSYQAKFLLEYERLKSGVLQRNDFFDIMALSTAMPYCDAVVFEKTFTNIARVAKVPGRILSTAKRMREFEEFLE